MVDSECLAYPIFLVLLCWAVPVMAEVAASSIDQMTMPASLGLQSVVPVELSASVLCMLVLAPPAVAAVVDVVMAMSVALHTSLLSLQMMSCMA